MTDLRRSIVLSGPRPADRRGPDLRNWPAAPVSVADAVPRLYRRARRLMPDRPSADRLLEAVLLRALAEAERGKPRDVAAWLDRLFDEEYRGNSRRHLS